MKRMRSNKRVDVKGRRFYDAPKTAIVIHHTDLDGMGVRLIGGELARKRGLRPTFSACNYRNVNHIIRQQLAFFYGDIGAVIIGDISVDEDTAQYLDRFCSDRRIELILVDHHKTAEWLNRYPWAEVHEEVDGVPRCATYQLSKLDNSIFNKYKGLIQAIDDWDIWKWEDRKRYTGKYLNSLFLMLGEDEFEEYILSRPNLDKMDDLISEDMMRLIKIKTREVEQNAKQLKKELWFTTLTYKGKTYKCGVCFLRTDISETSHYILTNTPEIDLLISWSPSRVNFRTIKNLDIKLGDLAKDFTGKGGGHPMSAGGLIDEMQTYRILNYMLNSNPRLKFSNLDHISQATF